MKTIKLIAIITITITSLMSCGGDTSNQEANATGFGALEKEVKNEFGADAYYTNLAVIHNKSIGNMISLTVTTAPESLKMEEWNLAQNAWKQNSEVTLEVPQGAKASDFMFQLDDKISLAKLGELVEESKKKLTADKNLENPALSMAFVKFPKNGDIAKAEYHVNLEPEHGGTTFTFIYKLNGELVKMDY